MPILFHFTLILLKLEHALITVDLPYQNPAKEVMLLYKKIVLIRCCKWISFQSADKIITIKITQPKRPFSTFSFTEGQ